MLRGAKAVVRETLRTGGKILTDITENKSPELSPKDIESKRVTESVQNLIGNLRGGGRKRDRGVSSVKRKKAKRARVIRTESHDFLQSLVNMSEVSSISSEFDIFCTGPFKRPCWGLWRRCTSLSPPWSRTIWNF